MASFTGDSSERAEAVAAVAREAGIPEKDIPTMVAIAMAESSGDPRAHNPNAGTGDNSYGLWQINMLGDMGPERREWFGIESDDDLFDPVTNAKAAYRLLQARGNFNDWSVYKSGAYRQYLPLAEQVTGTSATLSTNDFYDPSAWEGSSTSRQTATNSSSQFPIDLPKALALLRGDPVNTDRSSVLEALGSFETPDVTVGEAMVKKRGEDLPLGQEAVALGSTGAFGLPQTLQDTIFQAFGTGRNPQPMSQTFAPQVAPDETGLGSAFGPKQTSLDSLPSNDMTSLGGYTGSPPDQGFAQRQRSY